MIDQVRAAAHRRVLYLPHAVRQMARPDRMIRPAEVLDAILKGEVIEDYPEDARGHSCLLLGVGEHGRAIHVVCSPKVDYLDLILDRVPAWVCKQCGEPYFESREVELIQDVIRAIDDRTQSMPTLASA